MKQNIPASILITVAVVVLTGLSACSRDDGPTRETRFRLGTAASISIYDESYPSQTLERAFERVTEIQNRMSINEANYDNTEILEVNRNAGRAPVPVSDDTAQVVREGIRWAEITNGAFDISIAPLITLWGIGTPEERVPTPEEIESRVSLVAYDEIDVSDEPGIYLPRDGMAIDVGGIAKGYAVDEAARVLREAGVNHALVDFGGDIFALGTRVDGNPWRIGVQHPSSNRQELLAVIELVDQAVVSSGDYERFFERNGIRYHHIIDPETGTPSRSGLTSVTVIGPDAMGADALSTGVFVLGLEEGMALVETLPDYEAVIATSDRRIHVSSGMQGEVELRASDHELADQ
ncbi:MAG: FAD:protein FMN transferase [Spirochaetota bacterium]